MRYPAAELGLSGFPSYFGAFRCFSSPSSTLAFSTARWGCFHEKRWLPGRGAMRHVELDRRVLGLGPTMFTADL